MQHGNPDQLTDVVLKLFQLNGLLVEWGNDFASTEGLTSARWQMIGALALAARPLTAPQIAAKMGMTRQGAQKQLNLVTQAGLVDARPNPLHKRSPLYALTEQGQRTYHALDTRWKNQAAWLAASLSGTDLDVTASVLGSLIALHSTAEMDHTDDA